MNFCPWDQIPRGSLFPERRGALEVLGPPLRADHILSCVIYTTMPNHLMFYIPLSNTQGLHYLSVALNTYKERIADAQRPALPLEGSSPATDFTGRGLLHLHRVHHGSPCHTVPHAATAFQ